MRSGCASEAGRARYTGGTNLVWADEWEGDIRSVTVFERAVNRAKRCLN